MTANGDGENGAAALAEDISNTKTLDVLARSGFAVTGLLHILIGVIALHIAFGGTGEADPAGAVELLASRPLIGPILMWAGFLSCAGLSLWQLSEAFIRSRHLPLKKRAGKMISSGGLFIAYGVIALTFGGFALGRSADSGDSARSLTGALLTQPVGFAGLVVLGGTVMGIGVYFIVKALGKKFKEELHFPHSRRGKLLTGLGVVGHAAKGVALNLAGLLFIVAALKHRAAESTGLDGSLKALSQQPFGVYLLTAVALGLICYGFFAIVRAKYGRM